MHPWFKCYGFSFTNNIEKYGDLSKNRFPLFQVMHGNESETKGNKVKWFENLREKKTDFK